MKIGVLMTVYNESLYVDYAIRSSLDLFDKLSLVEGAYQETIKTNPGLSPRSTDGTLDIIHKYKDYSNVNIQYRNELSDPQQRTAGLDYLRDCDWVLICDADEVWNEENAEELRARLETVSPQVMTIKLDIQVFVNDFKHFTLQTMPRVFRMTPDLKFIGDNETQYFKQSIRWASSPIFWHYSYVKDHTRFNIKKKWWAARGGSDWFIDTNGMYYSPNHKIWEYTGDHPEIMKDHPYNI